jgi:hypothetical protein
VNTNKPRKERRKSGKKQIVLCGCVVYFWIFGATAPKDGSFVVYDSTDIIRSFALCVSTVGSIMPI